jgi:hypothetical protein
MVDVFMELTVVDDAGSWPVAARYSPLFQNHELSALLLKFVEGDFFHYCCECVGAMNISIKKLRLFIQLPKFLER